MTAVYPVKIGFFLLAVAAATQVAACSAEAATTGATDAGLAPSDGASSLDAPSVGANDGSSAPDSALIPDAGPAAPQGILIDVVHASPDLGAVGLCFAAVISGTPQFIAPFENVQGPLPRYAATQLAIPGVLQGAIGNVPVRIYAIPGFTRTDAGAPLCASAIGGGGTTALMLKEFAAGAFQPGKGYIVAVTGCASTASIAKCGADPIVPANPRPLGAWVREFDRTTVAASSFGAQFVHLSPQAESQVFPVAGAAADGGTAYVPIFSAGLRASLGVGTAGDAGISYAWAPWVSGPAAVKFAAEPSALAAVPSPGDPNLNALGLFTAANAGATPSGAPVDFLPFAYVELFTTGKQTGGYFKKGVGYTFFAVGDLAQSANPQAPNAGPDFFRVLALPNNAAPASDAGAP